METSEDLSSGEEIVYECDQGFSEDVECFVSLRKNHDEIFCGDGPREDRIPLILSDVSPSSCMEGSHDCVPALEHDHNDKKRTNDGNIIRSNKRRCLRTSVFGQLRINESSFERRYYNGFEKIINDGTVEKYVLGDRVYLLPSSVYEQMYIAQIESIYEEYGKVYVHCHWFERLGKNEVRLTNISDVNPIECIEGKCTILRSKKGTNLYCKNNYANGWFY